MKPRRQGTEGAGIPKESLRTTKTNKNRTVSVQSQCTYKRHLGNPRFAVLAEADAGAWVAADDYAMLDWDERRAISSSQRQVLKEETMRRLDEDIMQRKALVHKLREDFD